MRNRIWYELLSFCAALADDFFRDQETPNGFVGVKSMAGFTDFFFGHILLTARPGVAAVLDAVQSNLRILLTSVEKINLGVFTSPGWRGQLAFGWLLGAVIQARPLLGGIFG